MPLVNVRLSAEDARMAKALRAEGTEMSQLLRAAIRDAYARRQQRPRTAKSVRAFLQGLYRRFPEPVAYEPPGVDVSDRRAAAAYVRQRLTRKRPR